MPWRLVFAKQEEDENPASLWFRQKEKDTPSSLQVELDADRPPTVPIE